MIYDQEGIVPYYKGPFSIKKTAGILKLLLWRSAAIYPNFILPAASSIDGYAFQIRTSNEICDCNNSGAILKTLYFLHNLLMDKIIWRVSPIEEVYAA